MGNIVVAGTSRGAGADDDGGDAVAGEQAIADDALL